MKIRYDFHIHSGLSPCADDDMSPLNIAAMASVKGLDAVAVTDHNSIKNVKAAIECGMALGVTVIPGIEVQTAEDIHILGLFDTYEKLEGFFKKLRFPEIKNRPDIYGRQLIYDEDGEIATEEENLLHTSCFSGIYEVAEMILDCGGKAVPAHIDRDANGILTILGAVPEDLKVSALEFSPYADEKLKKIYADYFQLVSSDAHSLVNISGPENTLETRGKTAREILEIF